jgi:broad specificity phosphatase PhoE
MASQLLLMRHASLPREFAGRFNGRADIPLSPDSTRELDMVISVLRECPPRAITTSPLSRAQQSADYVCRKLGLRCECDSDLSEVDFGAWDGKTFAEIEAIDPDAAYRFRQWDPAFAFPGGESIQEFTTRVTRVTRKLCSHPESTVLAISHGGVIRQMICYLLGLSSRQYLLFDVQCAKITSLDVFGDRGVLTSLNRCAPSRP